MNNNNKIQCPLCNDAVDRLLFAFHYDSERNIIEQIKRLHPQWTENDGACSRCVDYYHTELVMRQHLLPGIGPHFPVKSVDDFIILPVGLRLNADPRYTGKGVTICFIDSGFYLHPDLTAYQDRVKAVIDITNLNNGPEYFKEPHNESWHGTMTSVVCAGDGYLSNGLYKGIACNANLVLLKVQDDNGKITTGNIVKALQWISHHHEQYNIRVVNISVSGDENGSYKQSEICKSAETLVQKGINIVAAAGNDENVVVKPPASSLSVIAVGGINDNNNLQRNGELYHSSFGTTVDALMKPELLAHAIWIAAPLLPGTYEQKESAMLHYLLNLTDDNLLQQLPKARQSTQLDNSIYQTSDASYAREIIISRIQTCKYISPYYMHVDGTSFAAPIVCSVIAQMLEANEELAPADIREMLFSTAKRIKDVPVERQGFGLIKPRNALLKALKRVVMSRPGISPDINNRQNTISFYVQHDCATQISLAGSFNHWAQDILLMEPGKNGTWKIDIPMLPAGKYAYKFFVDERIWIEDVNNPYREPDGFSGFNSILVIEQ